jgi:aquaporin Z
MSAEAMKSIKQHWPEYAMEAFGLGLFMVSACVFGVILENPSSPVRQMIPDAGFRRVLMGTAMGLTAIGNIYSPWGKRSGAHANPAVTLTFLRLGKVEKWDAVFYVVAQFAGGIIGVMVAASFLGNLLSHPAVEYVTTKPGMRGLAIAFGAEVVITFILMSVILRVSNQASIARYTGLFAGALVATYITLEAPLSGMSMNPARTFGSALPAGTLSTLWLYFTAPLIGMMLAAETYLRLKGKRRVFCAKLHHHNSKRCIFRCGYQAMIDEAAGLSPSRLETAAS